MNFDNIILEDDQKDLFIRIVEKVKEIPRDERMKMVAIPSLNKPTQLVIPSKKSGQHRIENLTDGDLEFLANKELLRVSYSSGGEEHYLVTPEGFQYYNWLIKDQAKPVKNTVEKIFRLPDLDQFNPPLRKALVKIDNLKKEVDTLLPAKEEYKEKFEKKVRLEWNYHSNKLEGNELSYGETRELLYHDRTSGKKLKDHREIIGHDEAITYVEEMVASGEPFTEKFIRELNKKVLKEPYKREALTADGKPTTKTIRPGQYKTTPNHVKTKTGDVFKFAEPHEVPQKMEELVAWYREEHSYPLLKAVELHYRFVNIHPFDDGNGRVARLLMNFCLMEYGFPPVVIKTEQKDEYHSCLRKADAGEFDPFFVFLGECLTDTLQLFISAAKGEDINEYVDLDKRLKVFDRILSQDDQEEIKEKKSNELLTKRLDDSIWPMFQAFTLKMEDFYRYFTEHELRYVIDQTTHSGKIDLTEIRSKFEEAVSKNENLRNLGIEIQLSGFRKGGLQPLNTSIKVQVEFQDYLYVVNPQQRGSDKLPTIKKLYHQTLDEEEIERFIYKFATNLMDQLEQHYEQVTNNNQDKS